MYKTKNNNRNNKEYSSSSSSSLSSSLSSDEEEIDARDLKPIKDYLSNHKELARQLFKSVKPEKIRMMLPQILKQMNFNELEEWCVSELSGMSKARILAILNGKPMLESSDTNESDDSGPSLEIISDTEEWLTDDDITKKENGGKGKLKRDKIKVSKGKAQINKKNNLAKSDVNCNVKSENSDKDVKIKKEENKEKRKEGDSLLDLLELEMRARAIRALIRKEEDIIPSINMSQANSQTMENNIQTLQDDAKTKENCSKKLEGIISAQQVNKGEDEDVVLVVQPTPVVELLSSEEETGGSGGNQKLEKEGTVETGKSLGNYNENMKKPGRINLQDSKEERRPQEVVGTHSNTYTVIKTDLVVRSEARAIMPERNVDIKNNTLSISISADHVAERRKKSKKKSHSKSHLSSSNESTLKQINTETTEQMSDVKNKNINEQSRMSSSENVAEEENKTENKIANENRNEEEKSTNLDEIIDFDDYCDVVMGIENCDEDKSQDKIVIPQEENKESIPPTTQSKSDSTETWASRYYQTDDVQNVIKESKIQSEIRKRLRERQRLSKLNKSPNLNTSSQSLATDSIATIEKTPTGSVEEYLFLKRAMNANISADNSDNNSNLAQHYNIMQDNSATVNPNSDITTKEISVQDENISSHQEYTDSDSQNANVSETITPEPAEVIIDIKNNTQPV